MTRTKKFKRVRFYENTVKPLCHSIQTQTYVHSELNLCVADIKKTRPRCCIKHLGLLVKSGLLDSNQRPLRPERSALPTALNPDLRVQRYGKFLNYVHFLEEISNKICRNDKKHLSLHTQNENKWCHSSVGRAKD